jgi:hypothetical protein
VTRISAQIWAMSDVKVHITGRMAGQIRLAEAANDGVRCGERRQDTDYRMEPK